MIQYATDSQQEFCINTFSFEYGVHIGPVAIKFVCKPSHRTFLAVKLCFYQLTDMYHFSCALEQCCF